jgi:hypothetical protein
MYIQNMMIILSLVAYLIATVAWFYGEARFIEEMKIGNLWKGAAWASLGLISIPLFTFGTWYLYVASKSWWIVQFPYWMMSVAVSYWAFTRVVGVKVSWHEWVCVALLMVIVIIMGLKTGD